MSSKKSDKKRKELLQEHLDENIQMRVKFQVYSSIVSRSLISWRNSHPNPYRDGRQYVHYYY